MRERALPSSTALDTRSADGRCGARRASAPVSAGQGRTAVRPSRGFRVARCAAVRSGALIRPAPDRTFPYHRLPENTAPADVGTMLMIEPAAAIETTSLPVGGVAGAGRGSLRPDAEASCNGVNLPRRTAKVDQ
jgi:hypothetical protein